MLQASEAWRAAFPGAAIGVLPTRGLANPVGHPLLERRRTELEAGLRLRYAGLDRAALKALPVLQAYGAFYRRFDKTYHLLLQLESVRWKGKPLPGGPALGQVMFLAELDSLLLTAGHDLGKLRGQLSVQVASGQERYTLLAGREQQLKPGDMCIRDEEGVVSSVLYGPDLRTCLGPATTEALYTVYAPAGIQRPAVEAHLARLEEGLRLAAPGAELLFAGVI